MLLDLLTLALATFITEDLTCIAAGVLIAQGRLGFPEATAACAAGILAGDLLLFAAGAVLSPRLLAHRFVRRFIKPEKLQEAARWIERKGLGFVLLSRFTPGLRLPGYLAAGMLGVRFGPFAARLALAAAVWTPLLTGATVAFGGALLSGLFDNSRHPIALLPVFVICATAAWLGRRRFTMERLRRWTRWEFWPVWAAYLPLVPWFLWLAARHRSLTVFTLANPAIPTGGLTGESKSRILRQLADCPEHVAPWALVQPTPKAVHQFLNTHALSFPVVIKPDTGERGTGVAIVRNEQELETRLRGETRRVIVQEYVPGVEFGVFYHRYPLQPRGQIVSITCKEFPAVDGDGASTVRELIRSGRRTRFLATTYERLTRAPLDAVPAKGEQVPLVEIGSHCRGAIFLDGCHLLTSEITQAIETLSQSFEGFYLGRYDIRAATTAEFRAGRFQVIELNGVAAEPTHIYDPRVSILNAYRALATQWSVAFEIGARNRELGLRPTPARELLRAILNRRPASNPLGCEKPKGCVNGLRDVLLRVRG
ncbi:MAG: hypothetical protein FJW40_22695 [Acidobacteria bacterium]|nr:hypothetical protein [Acidobacteriota bacterium]